jgi:hypothetical protein
VILWAAWRVPCRAETPHLKATVEAFGKDDRFAMIGLSLDDSRSAAGQLSIQGAGPPTIGIAAERVKTVLRRPRRHQVEIRKDLEVRTTANRR